MPRATELIGIPGIQQQRMNRIHVGLNAVELIGCPKPQSFPKPGFGMSLTQVEAGFGGLIAMELHHRRSSSTRQPFVDGVLGRVRDNPDTLQLRCQLLQTLK